MNEVNEWLSINFRRLGLVQAGFSQLLFLLISDAFSPLALIYVAQPEISDMTKETSEIT